MSGDNCARLERLDFVEGGDPLLSLRWELAPDGNKARKCPASRCPSSGSARTTRLVSRCGSQDHDIARASFAPWRRRGQSPVASKMLQSRIDLLRKQPALG